MSDHILYKSESLSEAAAELNRLMDVLDDVAAGLARVDTTAEWWSKVSVLTIAGRMDACSAVGQMCKRAGKVQHNVSETTSGVRKAQKLFDDAECQVFADVDAVCTGKGIGQNANAAGAINTAVLGGGVAATSVWQTFTEKFWSKFGWDQILKGAGYFKDIYGFIKDIRDGKTWEDFAKTGVDIYQFLLSASTTWSNYMRIGNVVGKNTAVQWWLKNVTGWKSLGRASTAKNPWTRFKNNLTNKTSPFNAQMKKIIGDFSGKNGAGKCIASWSGVAMDGVLNWFSNREEQAASNGTMSDGRVIAETITETAVGTVFSYGTSIVVGAAITTAVGSVAAPGILVVAGTSLVVTAINAGVEAITGKPAVEWASDLILDTGEAIGKGIGKAADAIGKGIGKAADAVGKWFGRIAFA